MRKRKKMSKRGSKKLFRRTAGRTHSLNVPGFVRRGGIRL